MLSDGLSYECSVETCPGRLQTCFCNARAPNSRLTRRPVSLSLPLSLSFSLFLFLSIFLSLFLSLLPFLPYHGARSTLPLHDRRSRVSGFTGTRLIVGLIHAEIRYAHYAQPPRGGLFTARNTEKAPDDREDDSARARVN